MTLTNRLRIQIFRDRLENDPSLIKLKDNKLSDDEILNLLDAAVLPNSMDYNNLKYSLFFHLIFQQNQEKKERVFKQLKIIIANEAALERVERLIIKFGVLVGFKSRNYRSELFNYINNPINLRSSHQGRKYISSFKFKDIFYFAYHIVDRAKQNKLFPRF